MSEDGNHQSRTQHRPYWEKACEDAYQRLIVGARRLANGRLSDAEDLAQETVCRALIYSRNPEEIRNPLSYLLRMMRNTWIDKWTKENTANVESLEGLLSTGKHPMVEPDILRILETRSTRMQYKSSKKTSLRVRRICLPCTSMATSVRKSQKS